MGSIAESLRKVGNLKNVGQNLNRFIEQEQKKQDLKDFLQNLKNTRQGIEEAYNKPIITGGNALTMRQSGTEPVDITQANRKSEDVLGNFLGLTIGKNIPGEDVNTAMQSLELQRKSKQPEGVSYKQFDPTKDLYSITESGKINSVKEGKPKTTMQRGKSIGSYIGKDGYHYTKYEQPDGTIKEVKSVNPVRPPSGNNVNIHLPKAEKWADFGQYLNAVEYDEEGKPITDKNQLELNKQKVRNIAKSKLLPNALNWYEKEIARKKGKRGWGREDISQEDFLDEIEESVTSGTLEPEEAQDLLDINAYRPFLWDLDEESYKGGEEE